MSLTYLGAHLGHIINFEILPQNAVIVDGGVCQGDFINELHHHTNPEKFKIIGFEASSLNSANMPAEFKGVSDVKIYNKILVGENSNPYEKFIEYEDLPEWGNMTGLYDPFAIERGKKRKETIVETITLKKIFDLYKLEQIDYLKLDIEGAEFDLVETMTFEVAEKIKQLSMEVHYIRDLNDPDLLLRLINGLSNKLVALGFETSYYSNELYGFRRQ